MRTAERPTPGNFGYSVEIDRHPGPVEQFYHAFSSLPARFLEHPQPRAKIFIAVVDEVSENVGLGFLLVDGADLNARDHLDAESIPRRYRFLQPIYSIVIGNRDGGERLRGGSFHHLSGRESAVRSRRMNVKIGKSLYCSTNTFRARQELGTRN
jgi:hypothetical protein